MGSEVLVASSSLADAFSELFVLGSYFREAKELGSVDIVRRRLNQMLETAEQNTKAANPSPEVLLHARYAIVAYLDEMLNYSRWSYRDQWASRPLQFDYFGEYVAGEGFYKRLEAIRTALPLNVDLLEIYLLCLTFGFEGQYKIDRRDQLKGLGKGLTREIQSKRGDAPVLSPHGRRTDELLALVKRELPAWAVLVTAL